MERGEHRVKALSKKLVEQEHVMVKMWKYFLHIRGEVVSEDYELGTWNNREPPSRET